MARESQEETDPCIPWPTPNLCGPLPSAYKILPASSSRLLRIFLFKTRLRSPRPRIPTDNPPHRTASSSARQERRSQSANAAPREGQASCPCRSAGGPHEGALLTPSDDLRAAVRSSGGRERASRPTTSAARRRVPPTSRAYFSDFKKGLVPSVSYPMQRKGSEALTGTELNAAVYRYLQDSGFVHTAFNFFYEADIEGGNIQGMIPQGTLIRIVHKGLEYIELEANSEIGSDCEHHFFDTLDLMTNDLDELRKKVTSSSQWKTEAVQNTNPDETAAIGGTQPMKHLKAQGKDSKEQNISSAEIGQKTGYAEASAMYKRKPTQKTTTEQTRNPDETATIRRTQTKHAKAQGMNSKEQNISSAETAQKTGSAETTTGLPWQISWIGKKRRLRK